LSGFNEKFYSGGILFQCLFDKKSREVLAAGGRYDKLIEQYTPKAQGQPTVTCHAVGMNLGWDRLVNSMVRYVKNPIKSAHLKKQHDDESAFSPWMPRRCDILVTSFDSNVLKSTGVRLVADLIARGFAAELSVIAHSLEDLLRHYREDRHSWIVIIKHGIASDKPDLKVRSIAKKEDTDLRTTDLFSYFDKEVRDREFREGSFTVRHTNTRTGPAPASTSSNSKANVDVLVSLHRSKKTNKWSIVEAAQSRSAELLTSFGSSPIVAIETKDEVMSLIRGTRLSDPDGWRRAIQSQPLAERKYLQDLHGLLLKYASRWKENGQEGMKDSVEGGKAFVYNFRTGGCVLYDLDT
jgi:translation initiation factor 2-alpha kinase 4